MRHTLRQMLDSGELSAAAVAPAKVKAKPMVGKKPAVAEPDEESTDQKVPLKPNGNGAQPQMGQQELHVHLHQPPVNGQDPMDTTADPDEEEEDQDPSDVEQTGDSKNASPDALNISKHVQDPVGATKKTFGKLAKTKMDYDLAREEAKRQLIGPQQVLQHVAQMHQLTDPMTGLPMGMSPNPADANGGVNADPTAPPQNMNQTPGAQQQNPNGPPGAGVGPRMQPPTANPGSATQGAQTQVRPAKLGVPKPGQSQAGKKAGNPSSKAKGAGGKSVKVEVKSAAELGSKRYGRRQIEAGAALSNLRF